MTKLIGFKLQEQAKIQVWLYGISIIFGGLFLLFSKIDTSWTHAIARMLVLFVLFTACLPMVASMVLSWIDFYNTFYGRRASLLRTLPYSRGKLFAACLLSNLVFLALSILWICAGMVVLFGLDVGWEAVSQFINEYRTLVFCFPLAMLCQEIFIVLCGMGGGILGFRCKDNKLAWSILFGIVIYFVCGLLMVAFLVPQIIGIAEGADTVPITAAGSLLQGICLIYALYIALLLGIEAWMVSKTRMDVE